MSIKTFIQSRSLLFYFILAYAISWGGFLLSFGHDGYQIFQGESVLSKGFSDRQSFIVWLAMLAGPSLACLLLTGIVDGKSGLKRLVSSMLKWNVNIKWYVAALFITPTLLVFILFGLVFVSPDFTPGLMLVFGLGFGLIGGFLKRLAGQGLRRQQPVNLETVIRFLNPVIRGWGNYFKEGTVKTLFGELDGYTRGRLRSFEAKKRNWNTILFTLPEPELRKMGLVSLSSLLNETISCKGKSQTKAAYGKSVREV